MIAICDAGKNGTTFGGRLLLSREFVNHATREYIHLEAHEVGADRAAEFDQRPGNFMCAVWSMGDNIGGSDGDGDIHHVVAWMGNYVPDEGMVEGTIPKSYYC